MIWCCGVIFFFSFPVLSAEIVHLINILPSRHTPGVISARSLVLLYRYIYLHTWIGHFVATAKLSFNLKFFFYLFPPSSTHHAPSAIPLQCIAPALGEANKFILPPGEGFQPAHFQAQVHPLAAQAK